MLFKREGKEFKGGGVRPNRSLKTTKGRARGVKKKIKGHLWFAACRAIPKSRRETPRLTGPGRARRNLLKDLGREIISGRDLPKNCFAG